DTLAPVPNLTGQNPSVPGGGFQQGQRELLRQLDQSALGRLGHDDRVEAAIANYELAFRMQTAVPELLNIAGESAAVRRLYGIDQEGTRSFGMQCLMGRRLVERGVRFVE